MKTVILKRKTTKQPNLSYVQHSVIPTPSVSDLHPPSVSDLHPHPPGQTSTPTLRVRPPQVQVYQ